MSFLNAIGKRGLALMVAVTAAHAASAYHVALTGELYPMRWGQAEVNDDVLPVNSLGGPITAKMGIRPRVRLVTEPGDREISGWTIASASLKNKFGTQTYWTVPETVVGGVNDTFELPPMRPHIEHAKLFVTDLVSYKEDPPGGGTDSENSTLLLGPGTDVFTVVSAPLAPMDKPWATFMPYVCTWGHGETTIDGAARADVGAVLPAAGGN